MKKILLASTAIAGAVLVSGSAFAQAKPISLGLGGYFNSAIMGVSQDNGTGELGNGFRNHKITDDAEVHFRGNTQLDNGLRVGARIELEGSHSGDQIDEAWVDFSGGYGRLIVGQFDGAQRETGLTAPQGSSLFGVNTPFFSMSNGLLNGNITTVTGVQGGDSEKIVYFTPVFSGFQAAFSYAPESLELQDVGSARNLGTQSVRNGGQLQQIWQVAATYKNDWVRAQLGYGAADYENPALPNNFRGVAGVFMDDTWSVNGGLVFTFSGFEFGGSFQYNKFDVDGRSSAAVEDARDFVFDLGVTYSWDAWKVGLTYGYANIESGTNRAYARGGETRMDVVALGVDYKIGPGVTLTGGIVGGRERYDNAPAAGVDTRDYNFVQFGIGSAISF